MTQQDNNPFASPPIQDEDPADAPLMDGDKIGRWLTLPLVSGSFNGAGIVGIGGATVIASLQQWHGNLMLLLWYSEGRTILGLQLLAMAIYGGFLGGLCGLIHGLVAFVLRSYPQKRYLINIAGYTLPLVILIPPALVSTQTWTDFPLSWLAYLGVFLLFCSLVFGWRMNRNIHKYLLSRFERESREGL